MNKQNEDQDPDVDNAAIAFQQVFIVASRGPRRPPLQDTSERAFKEISAISGTSAANLKTYILAEILGPDRRSHADICEYIANSCCHGFKINVDNIYKISKVGVKSFYGEGGNPFKSEKYRMMLWHGTKKARVAGILQNGFVRPATSGQMYGNGIYFADRASKSCNYCDGTAKGRKGYLFLCDVELGRVYKAHHGHNEFAAPPANFDSVKGNGGSMPNWKQNKKYYGSIMPVGSTVPNSRHQSYDLSYNEYIVYDPNRVRLEFLVEVSFS